MITHQTNLFQDNKLTSNDSPYQITSSASDTYQLTQVLKQFLPPHPRNIAKITSTLLKVVITFCLFCNLPVTESSPAINSFPTTEFTPTQFHIIGYA